MSASQDEMYRSEIEKMHGKVWDTTELQIDFDVLSFSSGFVIVRDRSTNEKGSMDFTHMPRFYFNFRGMEG